MMFTKLKEKLSEMKYRLAMISVMVTGLVASVSAVPLNGSINPILVDAAALFPYLVDLIVSVVPLLLIMAVVGLIVGLFGIIVSKIKIR
jgi:H+/Cl- antiporter ClcA